MTAETRPRIGFVGLGAMGAPMARTLLAAGFVVTVFDVDPARSAAFGTDGARVAATLAAVAEAADVLVVMVNNFAQASSALRGDGGAIAALPGEAVVMLTSTVSPAEARELAQEAAACGIGFVDAPVSGGPGRAATGDLTMAVSGVPASVARCQVILNALSSRLYPVGEQVGQALTLKIAHQVLAGIHIAAAAEAIALGERAGIAPEVLLDFVSHSAGNSWMFGDRGPRMVAHAYTPPKSVLAIFVKDLGIVHALGESVGLVMPVSDAAWQLYQRAAEAGMAGLDDSAVIELLRKEGDG